MVKSGSYGQLLNIFLTFKKVWKGFPGQLDRLFCCQCVQVLLVLCLSMDSSLKV